MTNVTFKYKSVCITGTLALMTREDAVGAIQAQGGFFDKSVSGSTNYLVIADKPGATKVNKAKILKIKTLTEKQFIDILRDKPSLEINTQEKSTLIAPSNMTLDSRDW
jgi:NAD-dependent DNA ligase